MNPLFFSTLPPLPLLLWETPPGLELILAQEGVPFARVRAPHPLAFQGGRFVLYDGRRVSESMVRAMLKPDHVALDIDLLRPVEGRDPFEALVDSRAALLSWTVAGRALVERAGRVPKAAIRRRVVESLRTAVEQAGGIWARLAPFPFPYRSAFNLRVDLDEPVAGDYDRFARARRPLDDCCTHFISTHAYGAEGAVLDDLRGFDSQSHGHYHVIYRDAEANRRNVRRAHRLLESAGIDPVGFAAPHGRWNPGLDEALEELGYLYSSDFQLGHDDLPFFPWREDGFSRVLQVPIHPICEGLFLEAGQHDARVIADYLARAVRAKVDAGEPAFVYGHPERRLAYMPEVLAALAAEIDGEAFVWRVGLTAFAQWWHWRAGRRWSIVPRAENRFEVQFEDWQPTFPVGLEILRGQHVASVPIDAPRTLLRLEDLAYERRSAPAELPVPIPARRPRGLKAAVREALDWETVTPLEDLPSSRLADRLKKGLRWWRHEAHAGVLK